MDQGSAGNTDSVANNPNTGIIVAYVCLGAGGILLIIALIVIFYMTCKGKLYKKTKVRRDELVLVQEDVNANPITSARSVILSEKSVPVSVVANSLSRQGLMQDSVDGRRLVVRTVPAGSTIMSVKSEKPYRVQHMTSYEKGRQYRNKAMSVQSLPRARSQRDIEDGLVIPVRTVYRTNQKPKAKKAKHLHRNGPAVIYKSEPALYTLPRGNRLLHMDKGTEHHVTRWLHSHPPPPRKAVSVTGGGGLTNTRPYVYNNPIYASSEPGEDLDNTLDHVDSADVKQGDMTYDSNSLFLRWSPNVRRKKDDSSGVYSTSQRSFDMGSHTITRLPEFHENRSYIPNGKVRIESL